MKKFFLLVLYFFVFVSLVSAIGDLSGLWKQGISAVSPEVAKIIQTSDSIMQVQSLTKCVTGTLASECMAEIVKQKAMGEIYSSALQIAEKEAPGVGNVISLYQQIDSFSSAGAEISDDLKVNENGGVVEGSISFPEKETSEIGNIIGENLEESDFSVRNVNLKKIDGESTLSCKGENCLIKFGSNEIQPNMNLPASIVVNENGEVENAQFTTNGTGNNFDFGLGEFYAPPNSRIYYDKESGKAPIVILDSSKEDINLENILNNKGEAIYERTNFKLGNYEILGIGGQRGRVLISEGRISKLFEDSEIRTPDFFHRALKGEINFFYEENFNSESYSGLNYVNEFGKEFIIGGKGFQTELRGEGIFSDAFESDSDFRKTFVKLIPREGEIKLIKNPSGSEEYFTIVGKEDFDIFNGRTVISTHNDKTRVNLLGQREDRISFKAIDSKFNYFDSKNKLRDSYKVLNEEGLIGFDEYSNPIEGIRQEILGKDSKVLSSEMVLSGNIKESDFIKLPTDSRSPLIMKEDTYSSEEMQKFESIKKTFGDDKQYILKKGRYYLIEDKTLYQIIENSGGYDKNLEKPDVFYEELYYEINGLGRDLKRIRFEEDSDIDRILEEWTVEGGEAETRKEKNENGFSNTVSKSLKNQGNIAIEHSIIKTVNNLNPTKLKGMSDSDIDGLARTLTEEYMNRGLFKRGSDYENYVRELYYERLKSYLIIKQISEA